MSKVLIDSGGAVRTITLNRPEKRNALDGEMLGLLSSAFEVASHADERVTVIRANGPSFCAGLDLRERLGTPAQDAASPIEDMLHLIEQYPLPVVAVVEGEAIAGGNELALHCDLVVASTEARFGMSLAQLGLAPSWFLAKKIMEVCGPVAAREVLLLGDPLPAERMCALGVISRAVPPGALQAEVQSVVGRLAANAPLSLRAMKALLVRQMQFRDGIGHEDVDELVATSRTSEDAREGVAARLEKRSPRFSGR